MQNRGGELLSTFTRTNGRGAMCAVTAGADRAVHAPRGTFPLVLLAPRDDVQAPKDPAGDGICGPL